MKCPAYKCEATLTIRDCAHILFDDDLQEEEKNNAKSIRLIMSLMRYRIEDHLLQVTSKHCKTSGCNGIFMLGTTTSESRGCDIGVCKCGASLCNGCGLQAHPGVFCEKYKKLSKDLFYGKIDAEARSIQWI